MHAVVVFDFDDTLVTTTEVFNQVRKGFCDLMMERCLSVPELERLVDDLDIANIKKAGYFAAHCFPLALREAYCHCCQLHGKSPHPVEAEMFENLGWSVFSQPPQTLEHAHEVLAELGRYYPLILLSKGENDLQRRRIKESGLESYFREVCIVGQKDISVLQKLKQAWNIDVSDSWMVGNSLKSDINPALKTGFKAIHFAGTTWHYENEEPVGEHFQAGCLRQVRNIILQSINDQIQ